MSQLPKKKERPDRVYGLRMTKSYCTNPKMNNHLLGEDLLMKASKPVLFVPNLSFFPFLCSRQSRRKGKIASARSSDATSEESDVRLNPLVWFFSYKGEYWRISAAFMEHEQGAQSYVRTYQSICHFD
jgi:hypothetical protein